jgi:hypothetical protein
MVLNNKMKQFKALKLLTKSLYKNVLTLLTKAFIKCIQKKFSPVSLKV